MSKNKDKHHSHEEAEKNQTADDGRRTTDDGRQTPEEMQNAECRMQNEDGGKRTTDDSPGRSAPAEPGGRKPTAGAGATPDEAAGQDVKLAQLQDRLLRLQADFDNFRKRTLREKGDLYDSANQALLLELLPVLDHLQLGIQAASAHQADPAFREGLVLIFDQLMGALAKFGLSTMETEKKVYDANLFEAVNALPSETEPEGVVLASIRCGYLLRNKLLRPAQVIVSSGPPHEEMKNAET